MTDEEKKKMADLEAKVAEQATQITTLTTDNEGLKKTVGEKDAIITQKNEDLVGLRKEGQALKALTAKEKEDMTAAEIRLHDATLKLQEDTEAFQKSQQESAQKEIDARKARAIDRIAGNDPEVRKKIEANYGRIVDHDKAQTDEEIAKIATDAFAMTGLPKPNNLRSAINGNDGGVSTEGGDTGFADSKAGTELMGKMGIVLPEAPKA